MKRRRVRIPVYKFAFNKSGITLESLERQKVKLDIEVVESLKVRYKSNIPLRNALTSVSYLLRDYERSIGDKK